MPEILDKETIKAISTDTRQNIVKMLAKRPYTASEIAKITKKHVTTVTEHLSILEKAGLVRKRESTNKWVYYELTDKGEHLFKPQFYSFVIVFSVSAVLLFTGFLRLFMFESFGASAERVAAPMPGAMEATQKAGDVAAMPATDYLAIILIALGIIGFSYLVYRKYRNK